jgi:hypothetical protein
MRLVQYLPSYIISYARIQNGEDEKTNGGEGTGGSESLGPFVTVLLRYLLLRIETFVARIS